MSRADILIEVRRERDRQDAMFGQTHDDAHSPSDWVALIAKHAGASVADGVPDSAATDYGSLGRSRFRKQMVRVAAVALAALEAEERRQLATDADSLRWHRRNCQAFADKYGMPVLLVVEAKPSPIERNVNSSPYGVMLCEAQAHELAGVTELIEPRTK